MAQKMLDKLPREIRQRIELYREHAKAFPRHRELYITKGLGYCQALKDAGIITEDERKILSCYITI